MAHIIHKFIYTSVCTEYEKYERIDISEGTDFNKTSKSLECMICHYWYFKDVGCKYQPYVCNGCHDFSMTV